MGRGKIHNFFRRTTPGEALRNLADVENFNKLANVFNDIRGEGCRIIKDFSQEGRGWIIKYDKTESDNLIYSWPSNLNWEVSQANLPTYQPNRHPYGCWWLDDVEIYINGIAINIWGYDWQNIWTDNNDFTPKIALFYYDEDDDSYYPKGWYWTVQNGREHPTVLDILPHQDLILGHMWNSPNRIFNRTMEGPLYLYHICGDAPKSVDYNSKSHRDDFDYYTTKSISVSTWTSKLYGLYHWGMDIELEDEFPNGFHYWDEELKRWLRYEPDEDAVDRNSGYRILLRYRNELQTGDKHGHRRWIPIREFVQGCRDKIVERINEDIETDSGLTPEIRDMAIDLLSRCTTSFAPISGMNSGVWVVHDGEFSWMELEDCTEYAKHSDFIELERKWTGFGIEEKWEWDEETGELFGIKWAYNYFIPEINNVLNIYEDYQNQYQALYELEMEVERLQNQIEMNIDSTLIESMETANDVFELQNDYASLDERMRVLEEG